MKGNRHTEPQRGVSERNRRKAAALSAEITQEGCLKVNCRRAARESGLGHSFSINRFSELQKVLKNAGSLPKRLFGKLRARQMLPCPLQS